MATDVTGVTVATVATVAAAELEPPLPLELAGTGGVDVHLAYSVALTVGAYDDAASWATPDPSAALFQLTKS